MASVTPVRLHYNTVYLVEDGGERVLIDTGPDYRGAREEIAEAIGGRLPDLVVATHGHHDHAGLGLAWQEAGVPVALGADDRHFTEQPEGFAEAELAMLTRLVEASGAPAGVKSEALAGLERRRAQVRHARDGYPPAGSRPRWPTGLRFRPFTPGRLLDGDCALPAGLSALASPGHTPGNLVVVHEGEGWLFSGDQLLPDITPTPGLQLAPASPGERFRSLPHFLRSLRRLEALSLARCFPGHGEPFDEPGGVVAANLAAIESRTERVLATLREGEATVYEIAEKLYPRALRRRFWQIVPTVIGHLDLLEARGLARCAEGKWEPSSGR
jgi:glyoxylase-like metal-dependent hydrolase (beta-lactamase superfamily II)